MSNLIFIVIGTQKESLITEIATKGATDIYTNIEVFYMEKDAYQWQADHKKEYDYIEVLAYKLSDCVVSPLS